MRRYLWSKKEGVSGSRHSESEKDTGTYIRTTSCGVICEEAEECGAGLLLGGWACGRRGPSEEVGKLEDGSATIGRGGERSCESTLDSWWYSSSEMGAPALTALTKRATGATGTGELNSPRDARVEELGGDCEKASACCCKSCCCSCRFISRTCDMSTEFGDPSWGYLEKWGFGLEGCCC